MEVKKILLIGLSLVLLVGCNDDSIYNSINPDKLSDSTYQSDNDMSHYTPYDYFSLAMNNLKNCEQYQIVGLGDVYSVINQKVNSTNSKLGSRYFTESLSKSVTSGIINIALAERYYQDENIDIYNGNVSEDVESAEWNEEKETVNEDEFFERYAKKLSDPFPYIVTLQTINDMEVLNESELTFKFSLDPIASAYYYAKQMQYISQLDNRPTFTYIDFTFSLNEYYEFEYIKVDEQYKTQKTIAVTCTAVMNLYFSYDDIAIPSLEETCSYDIAK